MFQHRGPGIVSTPCQDFQHAQHSAASIRNLPFFAPFSVGKPSPSQAAAQIGQVVSGPQSPCFEREGAPMSAAFPHIAAKAAAYQLFAFAEPDPEAWRALRAQGVDLDLVTNLAGPIVRTAVTFPSDSRFEYDSFGEIAFAMAVHGENAETVLDVVAWSARYPATFGTRFGTGILGRDSLMNPASYAGGPCCLFSSPLAWLQAGCAGAVVLDYQKAHMALLGAPGPLTTDTLDFAQRLVQTGVVPAAKLFVPSSWRNAG